MEHGSTEIKNSGSVEILKTKIQTWEPKDLLLPM